MTNEQPETNEPTPTGRTGGDAAGAFATGSGAGMPRPLGAPRILEPFGAAPVRFDAKGANHESPSWEKLVVLPLYLAVMVVIGAYLISSAHPVLGVCFILLALLPVIANVLSAKRRLAGLVGRGDGAPASEGLGTWLSASAAVLRAWAPTLVGEEVDVLVRNRTAEAEATEAWLAGAGEPERVETSSDDGTRLVGHALACNPGSGCWVVLAPGYRGSWRDGFLHARRYAEKGFNLLLVDMRGCGESAGEWLGLGWLDRRDLVAWSQWLAGRFGSDVRVVLHGTGMGGAAVLTAAAEGDLAPCVRAICADSAWSDVWNVAVPLIAPDPKSSAHPLIDLMRLALRLSPGGYDVALARPEAAVAGSRVPVILMQGDQDTVVPSYMAERLADACGGAASGSAHRLVLVEGAGHGEACLADPVGYYWKLFTFLERYL